MIKVVSDETEAPGCRIIGYVVEVPDVQALDVEAELAAYNARRAAEEAARAAVAESAAPEGGADTLPIDLGA